jgi:PQQ-dependent dehydrogenase (methanol/ethanol family)
MQIHRFLFIVACGAAVSGLAVAEPDSSWPMYNRSYNGQRFSSLADINTKTVTSLHELCHVEVAPGGSFEAGLVMLDGILYATAEQETIAIDARDCSIRWRSSYVPEEDVFAKMSRGVALYNGKVFRGTADAHVLALDAKSGGVQWDDTVGDWRPGESVTGAPLAWNGLIFAGISGSELGIKGRITAFDALNGREVWRFNTIPTGKEVGAESWKIAATASHGGGGSWSHFALDPITAELFVPVGNPAPDFDARSRPGSNLFTNSVVVLDARTGALKWWFQVGPGDGYDYDVSAAPILYQDSSQNDVVAVAGKDGYLRVIDRTSHALRFKTAVTTIESLRQKPHETSVHLCPGAGGGVLWNGPAYDASRRSLFVGAVDWCGRYTVSPMTYKTGELYFAGHFDIDPSASGWLTAIDSDTGAVKWRFHADAPVIAGVTATAGGLVLTGDSAGNFLALDSSSGALLKKIATGGAMAGGVITYGVNGHQYVAVTAGNVSRTAFGALGKPTVIVMTTEDPDLLTPSGRAERGKVLYSRNCIACHGVSGKAVSNHDLHGVTRAHVIETLKAPKLPMPKMFPGLLDEQDLTDLAEYLASFM